MTEASMSEIADRWLAFARADQSRRCLNIGCGRDRKENCFGVDIRASVGPDVVADLEIGLPFADNLIDFIWCDQVLEHIHNLIGLMNEMHRVLKPEGLTWIGVPTFPRPEAVMDPMHIRFFVSQTFSYFCSPSTKFDYGIKTWELVEQKNEAWGTITVLRKPDND